MDHSSLRDPRLFSLKPTSGLSLRDPALEQHAQLTTDPSLSLPTTPLLPNNSAADNTQGGSAETIKPHSLQSTYSLPVLSSHQNTATPQNHSSQAPLSPANLLAQAVIAPVDQIPEKPQNINQPIPSPTPQLGHTPLIDQVQTPTITPGVKEEVQQHLHQNIPQSLEQKDPPTSTVVPSPENDQAQTVNASPDQNEERQAEDQQPVNQNLEDQQPAAQNQEEPQRVDQNQEEPQSAHQNQEIQDSNPNITGILELNDPSSQNEPEPTATKDQAQTDTIPSEQSQEIQLASQDISESSQAVKPPTQQNPPLFAPSPTASENNQVNEPTPVPQPVLSRLASLRQRVEKDPMDGEAWIELITDAEKKGDLEKTREVYSSFLQHFPDAANQWIAYADLELGHGHFPEVEQIFSRCLRSSVSVELWAFYLNYIRRVNPVEGEKAAASRAIIVSAYDFSLNHIGIDRESGQIWLDYIHIVKAGEAAGTWQEQQKMDTLRKLYQRAVCIPLDNIEQIWKEYDSFEHQMSKMTAKKFLADKSSQYMTARAALKEMKSLTDPLSRPRVPVKPNWKRVNDHKQLAQWKAYLAWEEKNPLDISDKNLLNSRIQYAFRQATMHMRFYPEIWYLSATHLQKNDKADEALAVLQSGLTANPTSIVLTYAIVEAHENFKNYPACYAAFHSLIQYYHSEIDEINKTIEKEIAHGIPIIESKTSTTLPDGEAEQELTEEEKQCVKEEEQLRSNITALYKPKIDEFREAAASVWITEMRFARRTEGIKPARAVFTRARKAPYITSHVFEASAMMEYHWNKEPAVATKVFDLGLKSFSEDVNYVLQYLDFLITLNDDSNARALFEKTVSKIPPESARPLWRRWAAYEFIYGDKAASEKLNLRVAEIFPDWGVVERLSDRHAYTDLGDVLGRELGTAIEPIPLRNRSPSPVPAHLGGFVSKRAGGGPPDVGHHPTGIPSGPASYRNRQQQHHQRERSFSPDFRGKRPRGARSSVSPDRRNGPSSTGIPTAPSASDSNPSAKRGRDNYENNPKRNRYSSPPSRNRDTPPPAPNPYAWFPEGLRYFLGILPLATSFEGPRLDANTVLQVLSEATIPLGSSGGGGGAGGGNGVSGGATHGPSGPAADRGGVPAGPANRGGGGGGDGYHGNHVPAGWGPNRGSSNPASGRGGHNSRRGRRK
ncbi:hypothetical protein PCANC_08861 [Puccinia coronata f. sp. avenae]|uniref:mRNA 3'-end-processing protein RNA14 n=1 Tax=Puccinia coronata f. sp. avenae TaxID=200324 RepID=A0A2N5SYU2_9BASI|nr:hypothetical protein PCANC_08861 [Puccinia coronata f. sp. avenae]PLW49982.1 hypothetical protein PCASD_01316 [Puccinia coronata f. sp. avenae]